MRLLIVDGHYYAFRSFYAIASLSDPEGRPTNAIYGFLKSIRRMLAELKPDAAVVVFDAGIPERRLSLQPDYKANRTETPHDLVAQMDHIRGIAALAGFHVSEVAGQEADDVIATLAHRAQGQAEVIMATNDKDLMQMVTDNTFLYQTRKGGGYDLVGPSEVQARWGVPPQLVGNLLALLGDASDNIPGVPGVGEKTAASLLTRHGDIRSLLQRVDQIEPARIRASVESHRAQIESNCEMVRLDLEVPVPGEWREWKPAPRYKELLDAITRFGFKSLVREVSAEAATAAPAPALPLQQGELF